MISIIDYTGRNFRLKRVAEYVATKIHRQEEDGDYCTHEQEEAGVHNPSILSKIQGT